MSSTESVERGRQGNTALREGVLAGLIGAAVVAGWFLVLDMVVGRLFFTPAALGSALFHGAEGPGAVQITVATVLGYTIVHVMAFMLVGVVFAWLAVQAEVQRGFLMAIILFFVTSLTLAMGLMAILASWVLAALTWWGIAIGNLLAAGAMGLFLWKRHPTLGKQLPEAEEQAAAQDGTAGPGWQGPGPSGSAAPGEEPHYRPRGPSTPEGGKPT
jgi:hypothetical protein